MSDRYAEAGNKGARVRSDCWIGLKITNRKGIKIEMDSKVDVLYGKANRRLIEEGMALFGIQDAEVQVVDAGAAPFVLMARLEAVVRSLKLDQDKGYLPDWAYEPPESARDRFRRSRLYLPGDQPKLFINAAVHKPDGLIFDLEDSVSPPQKEGARILVRNALRSIDFMGAERMVRINQLPLGLDDLDELIPQRVDLILIPKVESPVQIYDVEKKVEKIIYDSKGEINFPFFMPIIESALGIINAYLIASASKHNVGLAIGLEDYTADIGTQRTKEGGESFFARSMIVTAARAAGIQPIDTVFSDVDDMEGLKASVVEAKSLGFDGKGCIHPRQIGVINRAFAPEDKEVERAKQIVLAFEKAEREGLGVVSLGSKMIDPPVVKRALKTIDLALKEGKLPEDWRNADGR